MTYLYAKDDGERLSDHTYKVLEGIKQLKNSISTEQSIFTQKFWKCLEYAAIIHDFGKASDNFQNYIKQFIKNEKPSIKINVEDLIPHSSLSPVLCNWFEWDIEDEWRELILSAVYFHHDRSKLYNYIAEGKIERIQSSELDNLVKEFENLGEEYLMLITRKINPLNYRFLKFLIAPENVYLTKSTQEEIKKDIEKKKVYIFFKGLLHRADHYASSLEIGNNDTSRIEIEPVNRKNVEKNIIDGIKEGKGDCKNLWQFTELNEEKSKIKNTILIGSTGIGKTEFAFLWGSGRKMFFTLPMRTMADQIYKRAKAVFGENVGLLHSSAVAVLPGILSGKNEAETSDIESHVNLSRNLSFPVIVSTGDQFLNISLKYPTYEKIMATLGYSNLIIDEIQAYSPETSAIIVKTIEEVVSMGGKFLLMTATLPEYIKTEIEKRTGSEERKFLEIFSKKGKLDITKNRIHLKEIKENKEDNLETEMKMFYASIKEIIKDNPRKKILITINTVRNAQELYSNMIGDKVLKKEFSLSKDNILLLHSRFIGKDRHEKVCIITDCDEKKKDLPEIKILITTQVIEASIDIDYDILISELASLDSLIQRMGRVNRNRGEYEPGKGDVYIINGFLKGADNVYKFGTLKLTSDLLVSINDNNTISEIRKNELVKEYYKCKGYEKIINQFKKNMDALDNLLLASSKSDAQKIFREVNSVTVIPQEYIKEFKEELDKIKDDKSFKFKIRKILLDYSTSIRFSDFIKKMHTVELGAYILDEISSKRVPKESKLKKFFKGYYVICDKYRWEYNNDIGLKEKESKKGEVIDNLL
jgi:CRISPR-associated endonuclease/helicase Cas3